jgi:cysteine desulfurase
MEYCFFDYNATTPLRPEARTAWLAAVDELWLNPSSPYRAAARVHAHFSAARARVGELFEVPSERVVFHSGATEGNNSIFAHWATTLPATARVAVSPTEHPSVVEAAKRRFGERVDWLGLDAHGAVDVAALVKLLERGEVAAVSVMAANNESGILNDWPGIAAECRARGVSYHCDASQWIGKLPLPGLGACDYVTGCAHKFGGPRGVGLSLLPEANASFTSLVGGAQEAGHRAGTEDVAGVLAMVAALEQAEVGSAAGRDALIGELCEALPSVEVIGAGVARLWNTALLILPEFASVRWIRALEQRGFLVSAGAACAAGKQGPSPVLAAMGLSTDAMRRALRVSAGWATTEDEWRALARALVDSDTSLRSEAQGSNSSVISIE